MLEKDEAELKMNYTEGMVFKDGLFSQTDLECRHLHDLNHSDICRFVRTASDCAVDEGFVDYTLFVYCHFSYKLLPLGLFVLVLWWLFLFVGLAVTADEFFCPSLAVISRTLHLSHNIAGVTFLAFGNGAPDIFSAIAAIGNAKNGDAGLAFGALFGAGVFVTTVVAGTIAVICPFNSMERPFLRDVIFYLGAVFWAFYILWKQEITQIEAIGFILFYIMYVAVVAIGRYIHQRQRNRDEPNTSVQQQDDLPSNYTVNYEADINPDDENKPLLQRTSVPDPGDDSGPVKAFLSSLNPIDYENWPHLRFYKRIYEIFKSPMMFFLLLTTPVVNYAEHEHNWNRYLNSLHCITGPMFCIIATKLGFKTINGVFPVWGVVLIIGAVLSVIVFLTSKTKEKPVYHPVFAYLGFLTAVIWIYCIANEIVNILQAFGIVFGISNAILGLTLLAWGNSIGDLISDTVMARQGYPKMGISACFGGPLFNLLLGVGIPFTIGTIKRGGTYKLQTTIEELVLAGFLGLSLVSSLLIVPLSKFYMSRGYGIYLLCFYCVFLTVALLAETGVIHGAIMND